MEIIHKHKSVAADFFLYMAVVIALYVSVASVLMLLFAYVDVLFPDVLDYRSGFSSITGPMSSLIVAFPLYIFLTRFLNQGIRKSPEKKELWIRRWLIFLTLFLAGVMIFVDFITLVRYFLNGETTMRFILKVLAVFIVSGSVFEYYLQDIKGKWETDEKHSVMAGFIAGVAIFAVVISGFMIVGTPKEQRALRMDNERVNDLQNIQWQVVSYWQNKDVLPVTTEDLRDSISGYVSPTDPETEEAYSYEVTGALSFTLCADFTHESRGDGLDGYNRYPALKSPVGTTESWTHNKGQVCFDREIDPDIYKSPERIF